MATPEQIEDALDQVYDPEIGMSLVDLGLIYGIDVDGDRVRVRMTLTTPGCPLHQAMLEAVREAVEALPGVARAEVELVWSPPWTPDRMSPRAKEELGGG